MNRLSVTAQIYWAYQEHTLFATNLCEKRFAIPSADTVAREECVEGRALTMRN